GARDLRSLGQQAHQRERGDGLAGPALADEAERLATVEREGDAAHRIGRPAVGRERDGQVLDFEEWHQRCPPAKKPSPSTREERALTAASPDRIYRFLARRGSIRSRRPSPSRLRPSTASAMAMPGKT